MQEGDQQHASLTALFTFVARDPVTKRSMPINPIQPQTPDEVALFQERQAVADVRKAARQGKLPAHRSGTFLRTNVAHLPCPVQTTCQMLSLYEVHETWFVPTLAECSVMASELYCLKCSPTASVRSSQLVQQQCS
jgi:hypothetical protein